MVKCDKKNLILISIPFDKNYRAVKIRHHNIKEYLSGIANVAHIEFNATIKVKENVFCQICRYIVGFIFKIFLIEEYYHHSLANFKKYLKIYLTENHTDVIVILLRPFYLMRLSTYIKKEFPNIKIVMDMSDPSYVGYSRFLHKTIYLKYYEKKYLSKIDCLIVLNQAIKNNYMPITKNVMIIEQGMDENKLNHSLNNLAGNSQYRPINLVYGGMFHKKLREPNEIFIAICNCELNLIFNVFTDTKKLNIKNHNINSNKIKLHQSVQQETLFEEYNNCDIIVHFDNFYGMQVPGKTFELLAFEKPILFVYNNDFSDTVQYLKNQAGVYMVKNDQNLINKALYKISENLGIRYKRDISKYTWYNVLSKLDDAIYSN